MSLNPGGTELGNLLKVEDLVVRFSTLVWLLLRMCVLAAPLGRDGLSVALDGCVFRHVARVTQLNRQICQLRPIMLGSPV